MAVGETSASPPLMASTVCSSELEVQEERKGGLASVPPTESLGLVWLLFIQYYPTDDANQGFRNWDVPGKACKDGGTSRVLGFSGRGGLCSLKGPEEVGQTETGNWRGSKGQMQLVQGRERVWDLPGKGYGRGRWGSLPGGARILREAAAWGFGRLKWRRDQKGPQQASVASLLAHGWGRIPEMWEDLPQATQWGSTWEVFISSCIPEFCGFGSGVGCPGHVCGYKGSVSRACWVFSDVQGLALIHFRTDWVLSSVLSSSF